MVAMLRQMNRDLDFGIEIVGVPIYREQDGLAMSSRNAYLSEKERAEAPRLFRGLMRAHKAAMEGVKNPEAIVAIAREVIEEGSDLRIDYLELRDALTLQEVTFVDRPCILATAVFAGKTRLIDNVEITPRDE